MLVGGDWNMAFMFHNILGIILPIDELIFFKIVKTTNQITMVDYGFMTCYDLLGGRRSTVPLIFTQNCCKHLLRQKIGVGF